MFSVLDLNMSVDSIMLYTGRIYESARIHDSKCTVLLLAYITAFQKIYRCENPRLIDPSRICLDSSKLAYVCSYDKLKKCKFFNCLLTLFKYKERAKFWSSRSQTCHKEVTKSLNHRRVDC